MKMKKLLLILSLCSNALFAQNADVSRESEEIRPVTSSLSLGVGDGKMRDTYLTNLLYDGVAVDIHYDRTRMMRFHKWNNLQSLDLSFMSGDDQQGGLSSAIDGRIRYRYAMHRVWTLDKYSFFVGPYIGMDLGFNYNLKMSNGNNPATVRLTENLGLSCGAGWNYAIRRQPCKVDLLVQTPLMGSALVPEYGASYYETFYLQEDVDKCVRSTSLHNQQDLDIRLTTDMPFSIIPWFKRYGSSLRLGVAYHIETMDINHIVTRNSTFQFVLGWTWQYLPYKAPRP